jgi:hypothetical protein
MVQAAYYARKFGYIKAFPYHYVENPRSVCHRNAAKNHRERSEIIDLITGFLDARGERALSLIAREEKRRAAAFC